MVSGSPGALSDYNSPQSFVLQKVDKEVVRKSYLLVDLSDQILAIQEAYRAKHHKSTDERKSSAVDVIGMDNLNQVKICIGVPITSKGTKMDQITDSPFWAILFDSFMRSIDWRSNRYIFRFYLGFDKADPMYDTGDAWSDMREEFRRRATYRMEEQMVEEANIHIVLRDVLSIKLMHFDHLEGAPSQIVSQLMLSAYADNFDYFYQVNDDTSIVTPNWAPKLITMLAANPSIPNFGVTGPADSNNNKIFTHSFVHRTHFEVLVTNAAGRMIATHRSSGTYICLLACNLRYMVLLHIRYLVISSRPTSRTGGLMIGSPRCMARTTPSDRRTSSSSTTWALRRPADRPDTRWIR